MNDELGDLLEPMVIEWTIDKLDDWVRRYKLINNLSIGLWQSVKGTLHITQEWAGGIQNAIIGFDGDPPEDGPIRLTPYLNDAARASAAAIADFRRLRIALEAAGAMLPRKSKRGPRPRTKEEMIAAIRAWDALDRDRFAITLEEWLEERYGLTGGKLNVPPSTFHGWRKLK